MPETSERPTIPRAEYNRRLVARRKRQRRKCIRARIIALLVMTILIIGIVLICKSCSVDKSIVGTWDYDAVTIYRFENDGKGALELPNSSYEFSYKINGNKLTIDFVSESAADKIYTYTVKGGVLTLVGEDDRTFVMKEVQ